MLSAPAAGEVRASPPTPAGWVGGVRGNRLSLLAPLYPSSGNFFSGDFSHCVLWNEKETSFPAWGGSGPCLGFLSLSRDLLRHQSPFPPAG